MATSTGPDGAPVRVGGRDRGRGGRLAGMRARAPSPIVGAMISYGVYRLIHFFGIFLLLTALGGAVMRSILGGARPAAVEPATGGTDDEVARRLRRLIGISHGVALFLILLGGFGMLARLDIGMPAWIWAKLGVWLLLGGLIAAANRLGARARTLWIAIPVLALVAAWLAYTKPI